MHHEGSMKSKFSSMSKHTSSMSLKKHGGSASMYPSRQLPSVMTEVTSTKSAPTRSLNREVQPVIVKPSHIFVGPSHPVG